MVDPQIHPITAGSAQQTDSLLETLYSTNTLQNRENLPSIANQAQETGKCTQMCNEVVLNLFDSTWRFACALTSLIVAESSLWPQRVDPPTQRGRSSTLPVKVALEIDRSKLANPQRIAFTIACAKTCKGKLLAKLPSSMAGIGIAWNLWMSQQTLKLTGIRVVCPVLSQNTNSGIWNLTCSTSKICCQSSQSHPFQSYSCKCFCFSVSPMKQKLLLNEERGACNGKSHASRIPSKSLSHPLGISLVVSRHVLGTVQQTCLNAFKFMRLFSQVSTLVSTFVDHQSASNHAPPLENPTMSVPASAAWGNVSTYGYEGFKLRCLKSIQWPCRREWPTNRSRPSGSRRREFYNHQTLWSQDRV